MADILNKLNTYIDTLNEAMLNEASSRYLQGWLSVAERMFDDIDSQFDKNTSSDFDYDNAKEMLKAQKEMQRYCKNGKSGAQKLANIFDKVAMKHKKGHTADVTVSIDADDLLGVVAKIDFEAWSTELNTFVDELRKAILAASGSMYTGLYKDNKKSSYLYQDKNTVYLVFGDMSVKNPMPEYNEFEHFVNTKNNIAKFKITF